MTSALSPLEHINQLTDEQLREQLTKCCGSKRWVEQMGTQRPYKNLEMLLQQAKKIWNQLDPSDWLEAFEHHPKIGDINSLRQKFNNTKAWASNEQAGVSEADEQTLQGLADGNTAYESKFGYIFIVCATGKSAAEMLDLLTNRLNNEPEEELNIAAGEQLKITHLRLKKWFDEE